MRRPERTFSGDEIAVRRVEDALAHARALLSAAEDEDAFVSARIAALASDQVPVVRAALRAAEETEAPADHAVVAAELAARCIDLEAILALADREDQQIDHAALTAGHAVRHERDFGFDHARYGTGPLKTSAVARRLLEASPRSLLADLEDRAGRRPVPALMLVIADDLEPQAVAARAHLEAAVDQLDAAIATVDEAVDARARADRRRPAARAQDQLGGRQGGHDRAGDDRCELPRRQRAGRAQRPGRLGPAGDVSDARAPGRAARRTVPARRRGASVEAAALGVLDDLPQHGGDRPPHDPLGVDDAHPAAHEPARRLLPRPQRPLVHRRHRRSRVGAADRRARR